MFFPQRPLRSRTTRQDHYPLLCVLFNLHFCSFDNFPQVQPLLKVDKSKVLNSIPLVKVKPRLIPYTPSPLHNQDPVSYITPTPEPPCPIFVTPSTSVSSVQVSWLTRVRPFSLLFRVVVHTIPSSLPPFFRPGSTSHGVSFSTCFTPRGVNSPDHQKDLLYFLRR